MATEPQSAPSFSAYRKWSIGFNVFLILALVLAVVVMVNYLSRDYFLRFHWSGQTKLQLYPRTVNFLKSLTNQIQVTIYYDKDDPLYSTISDLLTEYRLVNPRISVQTVDYQRDPGAAFQLKEKYGFLASPNAKNLIIFDCDHKVKPVEGSALAQYVLEQVPNEKEREFRRKPTAFAGERAFTSTLIAIANPKPLKAYFLEGDGEHSPDSDDDRFGYQKFAGVLQQNYIQTEKLSLLGTNLVPMDCNLLVVAGPTTRMDDVSLEKIEQYLNQGGRLLALFNVGSVSKETGLERVLAKWGVSVGGSVIKDPENTTQHDMTDMKVGVFSKHPTVLPLQALFLHLVLPRSIGKLQSNPQVADAPRVEEIAFSGPKAFAGDNPDLAKTFPLIVAVEKGAIKGVANERGTTRMVVAGDSIFLANRQIESAANRNFAGYAANWLLDRPQLLEGLEPRPITEYRLVMTKSQLQATQWILLGGMPGGILLLGGLVWLRRRR